MSMPGSSRTSLERSEPFEDLASPRLVGRAEDDVRRPALADDAPYGLDEIVAVDSRKWTPRIDDQPPQRSELYLLLLRARARRAAPRCASMSAPRRCAERHARRMIRCDFGWGSTRASTRSPHGLLAERLEDGRPTPRLDVLGHLAQRDFAQRGEVLVPEEILERDLGPLARVDLAGLKPLLELFRRKVDEHDLVGLVEDPVGKGLPDPDLVSSKTRRSGSRGAGR